MSNWVTYRFDEVIYDDTKKGTKKKKENYLNEGKYPIIDQGRELIAGYNNNDNGLYIDIPAIIFGDHTRIIKYIDFPFFLGADGVKILKTKHEDIDYKYLYYFFLKNEVPNTGYNRHFKWLKELIIPVPPIETQKQIAKTLDAVSELLSMRKQQLAELNSLTKYVFYDMFGDPVANDKGWEQIKLSELCDIVRGGSPRPIDKYLGGNIPWIKISDATNGDDIYLHKTKEHIIPEGVKKSRLIAEGSMIFANCGVSLGFARIITFSGCIHDGWLAFNNISDKINKIFLLKQLNEKTLYFRRTAPSGTQPNLNIDIMKQESVIIPPMSKQTEYVNIVTKIEEQKSLVKKAIEETQLLIDSLMSQYFD